MRWSRCRLSFSGYALAAILAGLVAGLVITRLSAIVVFVGAAFLLILISSFLIWRAGRPGSRF
jgi:hypothetical protein